MLYSYISVLPEFISKEISRAQHAYMNIHPPINDLVTPLPVYLFELAIFSQTCRVYLLLLDSISKTKTAGVHLTGYPYIFWKYSNLEESLVIVESMQH